MRTIKTNPHHPHVLIVTSGPLCQNPRPLKEALTLAAHAYNITVISVFQNTHCDEMDRRLLAGTNIQHHTLQLHGLSLSKLWPRARTWLARKLMAHLRWSSPWILGPVNPLLKLASNIPADLTIVHNEAPFWVGCELLKSGRAVAADFEDWYSEDLLPSARRARPLALIRRLEKTLLHQAAYCTTTSRTMSQEMAKAYDVSAPAVLPNCFPLQPTPPSRPVRPPELVWFSQTTGPGRGLEEFITLWGQLPADCGRLTLIGSLIPGFDHTLQTSIPPSAWERLIFSPPVPPDKLPQTLTQYDVGLALEPLSPANKNLTISNKLFQYFNAGLAVIATPTSGQKEAMQRMPTPGILVDIEADDIPQKLAGFLGDHRALRDAQSVARQLAMSEYQWAKYAPIFLELVASATAPQT